MEKKEVKRKVKQVLQNLKERIDKKLKEKCDSSSCCGKKDGEDKC